MPLPFEEWWKGHKVLSLSVPGRVPDGLSNLCLSFSGISNLHLSFQVGVSVSFGHIFSFLTFTAKLTIFIFTTLLGNSADNKLMIFLLIFPKKQDLIVSL